MVRFSAEALRQPSPLIVPGHIAEQGFGLPASYYALLTRQDGSLEAITEDVRRLFPTVQVIRPLPASATTMAVEIELHDGTRVPAAQMSEGLLYYLAFAALPYLAPTSVVLIEEPENGLHPARIGEVMRILRDLSAKTQVLMATHSPLVINELQPDEVTVVTRTREHGTKGVLMKDTPNFESRSKAYALGELWISYANGSDEGPLVNGGPRP
jgi:predicted ATPase